MTAQDQPAADPNTPDFVHLQSGTSPEEFVHLHMHSEYSMLDGLSGVDELVGEARRLGMNAMAITDHGALYGAIEFYSAAKDAGLKPIIGIETYVAPGKMTERSSKDRNYFHLVLLAQNETGYRNLLHLATKASLEGFFYKPRVDHDLLEQHHEGLIALSACYSGEPSRAILNDDEKAAREVAAWYRDVFKDRYYLEIQDHGNEDDRKVNSGLIPIARDLGIPLVATNDSHYARPADAAAQDLLLCIQTNSTLEDPNRMRMQPAEFYLKSPQQMHQLFAEVPEALRSTVEIAERCNLKLRFDRLNFPELSHIIPQGESPEHYLDRVCHERLAQRYRNVTSRELDRLRYELDVINKTGFAPYMLFVWDFVDWARRQGILCGPRGSAAGSIVLYCLGVSDVDPLAYGLTFERFLNPERIQMPDIDMDFADDRREDVIQYVVERYGRDHVAQIITFGRLLARAAIRDVGRTLSYPLSEIDRVAKLIPTIPVGMTIERSLQESQELKQLYQSQPEVKRLIDAARSVEGVTRHAGMHAAGVVVSGEPLVQHVPLQRAGKGEAIMTQYPQKALEKIGLLKMDFLGLANLTMLAKAVENVEQVRGLRIDLGSIPHDDKLTYDMLARGETNSVFQLEGSGMTRYLKELRPVSIDHLAAMVALYRPGPMAHIPTYIARRDGKARVEYADPSLEPILQDTYGIIVYQDQVLQVVQRVAGYSLGQADILRRAMGKKLPEEMRKEQANFLAGAKQQGYSDAVANRLWEYIEPFAGYAFNRAHAYCYAFVAYQTAYMKANYPVEWMAAVLTTEATNTDKVVSVIGECRRIGIPILPPDVNNSQPRFTVERVEDTRTRSGEDAGTRRRGDAENEPLPASPSPTHLAIRYGLAAIKNVGEGAVQMLVQERDRGGPYSSLEDLCRRVDLKTLNKRVLESLIKAGALDRFGRREQLLAALDKAMSSAQQLQKAQSQGQASLFDTMFDELPSSSQGEGLGVGVNLPAVPPVTPQQRLAWEKEVLELYLSDHPFQEASRWLAGRVNTNTSLLDPELAGEKLVLAGAVASVRRLNTKKGETMVVAQLEDLHGTVEVVVFPRLYQKTADLWREDAILVLEGKLDTRDDRRQVIADAAEEWVRPEGEAPPGPGAGERGSGGVGEAPANGHGDGETRGRGDAGTRGPEDRRRDPLGRPGSSDLPSQTPATPSPSNGNGHHSANGYTNGATPSNGNGHHGAPNGHAAHPSDPSLPASPRPPSPPPPLPPSPAPGSPRLIVTLVRTGDEPADVRRLEQVDQLLKSQPGAVPCEIVLAARGKRIRLCGPSTTLTPQLQAQLTELLGPERVQVVQSSSGNDQADFR